MRIVSLLIAALIALVASVTPASSQTAAPVHLPIVYGAAFGPTPDPNIPATPTMTPAATATPRTSISGRYALPCRALDSVQPSPVRHVDGYIYFTVFCISGLPSGAWVMRLTVGGVQSVQQVTAEEPPATVQGVAPIANVGSARGSLLSDATTGLTFWSTPSDDGTGRGSWLSIAQVLP